MNALYGTLEHLISFNRRVVSINPVKLFITKNVCQLIDLKIRCTPQKKKKVFSRKVLMVTGTNLLLPCRWQPAKESCSLVNAPDDPCKNQPLFYRSALIVVKCRLMLAKQQAWSKKTTETSAQHHKQDFRARLKWFRHLLFNVKMRRTEMLFVQMAKENYQYANAGFLNPKDLCKYTSFKEPQTPMNINMKCWFICNWVIVIS